MRKFLKDVVSTLYASDGAMSLFRLLTVCAFILLVCVTVAECCGACFAHYNELVIFTGTMAGIACGNKLIKTGGGGDE